MSALVIEIIEQHIIDLQDEYDNVEVIDSSTGAVRDHLGAQLQKVYAELERTKRAFAAEPNNPITYCTRNALIDFCDALQWIDRGLFDMAAGSLFQAELEADEAIACAEAEALRRIEAVSP